MFTLCTIVGTKFICVGSDSYISTWNSLQSDEHGNKAFQNILDENI
jgi:hypothetical protein